MKLYWFFGPNGLKTTIALAEMELACEIETVDILRGEQDEPAFRAINPNGKIPALVDGAVRVFESCAILQYLGRKTGRFYPQAESERAEVDSWLFWQASALGPMLGQVNWFARAAAREGRAEAETALALHRFRRESARLFAVLEQHLRDRDWLGQGYSIADIACWPWVDRYHANAGGLDASPALAAWHARIAARPTVIAAVNAEQELASHYRKEDQQ